MIAILLITSDVHGNPNAAGGHGHLVVVADSPIPTVSQMQLPFGGLDNVACAVADTLAVGLMFGKSAVPSTVLADEHTSFPNGTAIANIPPTLAALFGISSHVAGGDPPGACWVMNPAWGGLIQPAYSWPYLAASQHQWVVIDDVAPASTPHPTGGTPLPRINPATLTEHSHMDTRTIDPGKTEWFPSLFTGSFPVAGQAMTRHVYVSGYTDATSDGPAATQVQVVLVDATGAFWKTTLDVPVSTYAGGVELPTHPHPFVLGATNLGTQRTHVTVDIEDR